MTSLYSILEDQAGGLSTTRLIVLAWSLGMLVVWVSCSIKAGSPQPIPESVLTLFGLGLAGKIIQRPLEKSDTPKP